MPKIPDIKFKSPKILCLGDIMLDSFVYGTVDRISPEAPTMILKKNHENKMLGGVGNVVANLSALNCDVTLISVIGDDAIGKEVIDMLSVYQNMTNYTKTDKNRITTIKTRFVCGKNHMLRVDAEDIANISQNIEDRVLCLIESLDYCYDVVILSDYCKGFLTENIIKKIIEKYKNSIKIVDTKTSDLSKYKGVDLVVPNIKELEGFSKKSIKTTKEIIQTVEQLSKDFAIPKFLVTRGSDGMLLVEVRNNLKIERNQFNALNSNPIDVSGAGDTVVATLALCLGNGLSYKQATEISNISAGIVVGKFGTSTVSIDELTNILKLVN